MTKQLAQQDRDERDLRILSLLDDGLTQQQVCDRIGVTRGLVTKLLGDIRKDEAKA